MLPKNSDYIAGINAGLSALRHGHFTRARDTFKRLIDAHEAPASALVGLAMAKLALDAAADIQPELEKALKLEPGNLWALVMKGDDCSRRGDQQAASAHYLAALKTAPPRHDLPTELASALDRAEAACRTQQQAFSELLESRLKHQALALGPPSERFTESIDILLGRRKAYFSSPRYYHFPGLASISFHERSLFPWIPHLEAETANIREELLQVLQEGEGFKPYIESRPGFPNKRQDGLLDNPDWSAFYLYKNGGLVPENARRCPRTMQLLSAIPLTQVPNRSPTVLFSLLRPGAHIPAHCGLVNTRLICHLPLVVPPGCEFRVGNEVRPWQEGKAWLFDDTIEHEAWNRSDQTRVILLLEVWRPELTEVEKVLVCSLFEAIDAHLGAKPVWEI